MSVGGGGPGAYRLLLRILPREFRERHGEELERVFEDILRRAPGRVARARLWVVAVIDVGWSAWSLRLSARARRRVDDDDGRGGVMMDAWMQDIGYALRQVAQRPGFSAVLVLTLALGIGANTAVFSVVNGVVLRPLPYPEADRLTVVWSQFPTMDLFEFPSSWPEYDDYRTASRSFEELGAWARTQRTLTGGDAPERLRAANFTWTMFPVLGVEPVHGRTFGPEEDVAGSDDVVLLSHGLWQRRFGGDPGVIGRTVELDGRSTTVLGVMPEGFAFPDTDTDVWLPAGIDPANPPGRSNHYALILGRLAPGVALEAASAELAALMSGWDREEGLGHHWTDSGHPAFLRPLHEDVVGDTRASLIALLGAVGLVLLIACANVANLLLVRAEGRSREMSVRSALGAGRGRLIRQLVTESLIFASIGGVVGVLVAKVGLAALLAVAPTDIPRLEAVALDGTVLAFSAGVTLLSGLLFGLAPVFRVLRTDLRDALHGDGMRGGTADKTRFRLRRVLVVSQTALAAMLLVGGGLLLRSFGNLTDVDPGFGGASVVSVSLSLPQVRYPEPADVTNFYRELLPRVSSLPGVGAAGLVLRAPLTGGLPPNDIEFEDRTPTADDPPMNADIQVVSVGYFEAMAIPLLLGRQFDRTDDEGSEVVAVVDEPFARRFFTDPAQAIGARVRQFGRPEFARVVGVVGAVRQEQLSSEPRAQVYFLHEQSERTWGIPLRSMSVMARTDVEQAGLVEALRGEVRALDPNLPVFAETTVEETLRGATASERFNLFLQLVFAGVALVLAAIGIYGVLSYQVQQRTREIGIRLALGAERDRIVGMVVRQAMVLVIVAVVVGLLGAMLAGGLLSSLLYQVSARDPITYAAVTGVLLAVALLACWIPARRASGIDPQSALRSE